MRRGKRAFTILELITVVAIIGLLIAIIVPSLQGARRSAKANVCVSKLKGLGLAFSVYLNENRDMFPPYRLRKVDPSLPDGAAHEYFNEVNNLSPRWHWFLELDSGPVIDDRPFRRLRVPWGDGGLSRGTDPNDRSGTTMTNPAFECPSLDQDEFAKDVRNGAYGYNYQYLGNTRQHSDPKRWDNFPVASHRIKSPSQTVLIADSRGGGYPHGKHSYALDPPRLATEAGARRFSPSASDLGEGLDPTVFLYSPVEMRHEAKGNVAFIDNHAEAMTAVQLGYEITDSDRFKGVQKPVTDPAVDVHATNKLWNGLGNDPLAGPRTTP